MSKQPRAYSAAEAITNAVVGFVVSLIVQFTLYPILGIEMSTSINVLAVVVFTVSSTIRSYAVRRFFNQFNHEVEQRA